MAKNRNKAKTSSPEGESGDPSSDGGASPPGPALRIGISLFLAWHLFVVFIAPMSVEPTSVLVANIAGSPFVRWYSEALYLHHGYRFFGPNPPTNNVVRYRVTDSGGAVVAEGELPNKQQQRPRLYYHRHMMLSDQAGNGPGDIAPEEWLRLTLRAYGRQLLRRHGGEQVAIEYVRHLPLYPWQARDGADPNAPEFFEPVLSLVESARDLEQPLPVPALPEPAVRPPEPLPPGGQP